VPRLLRQHHSGWCRNLRVQVHRPCGQQAAHDHARRLQPGNLPVEDARSKAYALKGKGAATLVAKMHQNQVGKGKHGKTVAEIIELRIDWMQ
jgi:hypothetical protein